MTHKKIKLIVNPSADLARAWRKASDLRPVTDEFGGADWSGTVYPTHAMDLARQAAEDGYELVIAVGGDGTVHEVVNGLMQVPAEQRPAFGVIPVGSGNDFAHAMKMDHRPAYALRQILQGSPQQVDIIRLVDDSGRCEYADNTVGIGFDATVVIRSRNIPIVKGFFIYLTAVLQTILLNHDAPRMKISSDQEQWEEAMLMMVVCNGTREGGGFLVAPEANNQDGWLNYAGIRRVSRPMMLRLLPEVLRGTHGGFPQVRMGKLKSVELEMSQPLPIHADGEVFAGFGMDVRRLTMEVLPGELRVMC